MDTELKKKLIEAAEIAQKKVTPNQDWGDIYHGFKKGAEWGYKEAVKEAIEWLKQLPEFDSLNIIKFDIHMNKPWE